MICVYALVSPSRATPAVLGLKREPLRRLPFGRIDAIVGNVAARPAPTGPAVRRYDEIIRILAEKYAAVLPARFGTCVKDLGELAFIIESREASFARALRLVRRRVQMTIRIFERGQSSLAGSESPRGVRAYPARQNSLRGQKSGAEYLRARAAARSIPGAAPLRAAVKKWVAAERVERHEGQSFAGSIYHLIARSAVRPYQRAVERAAAAANLTTIVSGPWPPYAFADWDG